jgi:DNA-binding NarL/FixJ family response regulator
MTGSEPGLRCVLLADRHHGLCEGVRMLLSSMFEVVVMGADEPSLIESASRLHPALAVVDLSLGPRGGLGWMARLRADCPGLKVIVVSVHDEAGVARAAKAAGADGFVLKRAIATELLPAAETVLAGRSFP